MASIGLRLHATTPLMSVSKYLATFCLNHVKHKSNENAKMNLYCNFIQIPVQNHKDNTAASVLNIVGRN